uniref:Putative progesterone 5-beta-reductase n=1 Tax=Tarenaya spinosa TaxID=228870 RepID=W6CRF5_9ROSI|nr:putative progesterone 5-beta-reductase [Tarenaya spinosa]
MCGWWGAGAIGAAKKKLEEDEPPPRSYQSVGLIIGVTGIVGNSLAEILPLSDTPGGPWKVYGVARRPQPSWNADHPIDYIQCDVSDTDDVRCKLSPLTDVTHIFFVAWTNRGSEPENCETNAGMLRNVLRAIVPHAPNLRHVCSADWWRSITSDLRQPRRVLPRSAIHGGSTKVTDSELLLHPGGCPVRGGREERRLDLVCTPTEHDLWVLALQSDEYGGYSLCIRSNLQARGISIAIPRKQDCVGRIRGFFGCGFDSRAADLGSGDPYAGNEAFNCSNGDVFKWKHMWKVLAEQFGIEEFGFEEGKNVGLGKMMEGKERVWEEIVKENQLKKTKMEEVGVWWFADVILGVEGMIDSMNKSKEHGFLGFRNSKNSFISWIDKYKAYKIVP